MNNFDGQLKLYPEICIDNFSSDVLFNERIKCFILTHFHDDHMKNLEDLNFLKILKDNFDNVKFFCSTVTKNFIETCDKYCHLADYCNVAPTESPFIVKISSKETVTITFTGSGHCPGSVMAFIEGMRGNVLFTGDFRLPIYSTSKLTIFYQSLNASNNKQLKNIDDIYIDMTFFKPSFPKLPSREESIQVLLQFLKNFLEINKKSNFENLIYLKTSARIGYEFVFQEINRFTGFKIHVNNLIYSLYDKLPGMKNIFTLDPYETPIHCCLFDSYRRKNDIDNPLFEFDKKNSSENANFSKLKNNFLLPCLIDHDKIQEYKLPLKVNSVKVILSAMYFTDNPGINKIFIEFKPTKNDRHYSKYQLYKKIYRLCYSFHSSMEEIIDFVNTLKPKRIYPIALPESTKESTINSYFYDDRNEFIEFNQSKQRKNFCNENNSKNDLKRKKSVLNELILKKRNSLGNNLVIKQSEYSSDEELENSQNEFLKFNDLGD